MFTYTISKALLYLSVRKSPSRQFTMSWMDSWSRPSKQQATPAPFYLIPGAEDTPYCKSCGRVMSTRKADASKASKTPVKYCSARCRNSKPGKLDRDIEHAFVRFLNGEEKLTARKSPTKAKGDKRLLVPVDDVQEHVFGHKPDEDTHHPESAQDEGRDAPDDSQQPLHVEREFNGDTSEDPVEVPDYDVIARMSIRSGSRIRPAQTVSEVNGSVGGEKGRAERIEETNEMKEKRSQGLKAVKEKEMVRSAARRGVVFGFVVNEGRDGHPEERMKCEAVMHGKVVEPSFAKGNWSIRWRE